jgi:hypothetical protein
MATIRLWWKVDMMREVEVLIPEQYLDELLTTKFHEAGHATQAGLLGAELKGIGIAFHVHNQATGWHAVNIHNWQNPASASDEGLVLASGAAAEAMFTTGGYRRAGSERDINKFSSVMGDASRWDEFVEQATQRLQPHRSKIEAMGNAVEVAIRTAAGLIPGVHPTEKYLQPLPDDRMGFIFVEQNTLEEIMTTK